MASLAEMAIDMANAADDAKRAAREADDWAAERDARERWERSAVAAIDRAAGWLGDRAAGAVIDPVARTILIDDVVFGVGSDHALRVVARCSECGGPDWSYTAQAHSMEDLGAALRAFDNLAMCSACNTAQLEAMERERWEREKADDAEWAAARQIERLARARDGWIVTGEDRSSFVNMDYASQIIVIRSAADGGRVDRVEVWMDQGEVPFVIEDEVGLASVEAYIGDIR